MKLVPEIELLAASIKVLQPPELKDSSVALVILSANIAKTAINNKGSNFINLMRLTYIQYTERIVNPIIITGPLSPIIKNTTQITEAVNSGNLLRL